MDNQYMQLLILTYLRVLFRSYTAENCRCLSSNYYYLRCLHVNKICLTNERDNYLFFENVLRNCTTEEYYTSELTRLGYPSDTNPFKFIGKYFYQFFDQLEIVPNYITQIALLTYCTFNYGRFSR